MFCLNYFSECCQGEIFFKFENMQCMGLFKICGVFNKLCGLIVVEKCKGVVVCLVGNYVQGVLFFCVMFGIDGKVVMLKGVLKLKVVVICDYLVEVVLYGDNFNDIFVKVSDIVEFEGCIFIFFYDDLQVIVGQGMIGFEILEDLYDVDNVIVFIGGGGLIVGIVIVIKFINLIICIIGVQLENVYGMVVFWYVGEIISYCYVGILVDGCDVVCLGKLIYEIVCQLVDDIVLVSEDDICQSMVVLIQCNKVIIEGVGVLVCVVLLSGKFDSYIQNCKMVSLIFGGNIDFFWVL